MHRIRANQSLVFLTRNGSTLIKRATQMSIRHAIHRFARNQGGSITMMFGLGVVMLMLSAGLAIDGSRTYYAGSRILMVLDAAAFAGARQFANPAASPSDIEDAVNTYFNAHIATADVARATFSALRVTSDAVTGRVTAEVDVTVPTTFGRVVSVNAFQFTKAVEVEYKARNIEMAMVLDITGSMCSPSCAKLDQMIMAAKEVVDTLLDGSVPGGTPNRIALAPYSASVNAGGYRGIVSSGISAYGDDCVIERDGIYATNNTPPSALSRARVMETAGTYDPANGIYFQYSCPSTSIMALSSDRSALKSRIESFAASGGTAGHLGTAWGWYLLTRSWNFVWGVSPAPAIPGDNRTIKAMLIMTDGVFNTAYKTGTASAPTTQIDESYADFSAICAAAKLEGIQIYTVAFGLSAEAEPGRTRARDTLRTCASAPSYAFDVEVGADLAGTFRQIADQLLSLRLTN